MAAAPGNNYHYVEGRTLVVKLGKEQAEQLRSQLRDKLGREPSTEECNQLVRRLVTEWYSSGSENKPGAGLSAKE